MDSDTLGDSNSLSPPPSKEDEYFSEDTLSNFQSLSPPDISQPSTSSNAQSLFTLDESQPSTSSNEPDLLTPDEQPPPAKKKKLLRSPLFKLRDKNVNRRPWEEEEDPKPILKK